MAITLEKSLDDIFTSSFRAQGPGAAVIAVRRGEVIYRKGFGMANLELCVPIEPDMVFRLGSVTKQFTAVAILMLLEQGKLALSDAITQFLPDYPTQNHTITVEHLLTHTSGIKSYTDMPEWVPLWRKDFTVQELVDFFKDQPMEFTPGQRWAYNNSGYFLLGAIIEKVSGISYAQFIRERIFEPLEMRQSYYDDSARIIPRRASGYDVTAQGVVNAPYLSMTQPFAAGSLASTVDDLAKWDAALYTEQLIKQDTLALAFKPFHTADGASTYYGYGWAVGDIGGMSTLEHGGGINGFVCYAMRIPSESTFLAILTNSAGDVTNPELLALKAAGLVIGHPFQEPAPVALSVQSMLPYQGIYSLEQGPEVAIRLEGDALQAQLGERRMTLLPMAETEFFVKESPLLRFRFSEDAFTLGGRLGQPNVAHKTEKPLTPPQQ